MTEAEVPGVPEEGEAADCNVTLWAAIGTLAKDEANLKNMQAQAERYTALYEAGVVSKEQQQLQVSDSLQQVPAERCCYSVVALPVVLHVFSGGETQDP